MYTPHLITNSRFCIGAERYVAQKNVLPRKGNRICKYALDYKFHILVCILVGNSILCTWPKNVLASGDRRLKLP